MKSKKADSNFSKDLLDPQAGKGSGLYNTIAPIVESGDGKESDDLKEQVRQGLVGLEYLTGAKKNKVNTFFDEHPVEALTGDFLSKSPLIGAILAGGGLASNLRTQKKNFDNTMMAEMARSKNPKDATKPENLLRSDREDIANILGGKNSPERLEIIDRLSKKAPGTGFKDEYADLMESSTATSPTAKKLIDARKAYNLSKKDYEDALDSPVSFLKNTNKRKSKMEFKEKELQKAVEEQQNKLRDLFQRAGMSAESSRAQDYTNLHESFKKIKEKGGLRRYRGEGLHDRLGDSSISNFIKDYILPQKGQAAIDMLERHGINAAHPNLDKNLIKKILSENLDTEVSEKTLNTFLDPKKQKSSIVNFLRRHRFPLYAGAATAAAGTGLYQLLKSMQNQRYSEEQQKEWQRNALKAQGRFREAEQL